MYKEMIARYIDLVKEFGCAIAIFTEDGKILHLNDEALGILGRNIINLEVLPGRYVENEDFWDNLHRYRTLFTHKALLKAGTQTYKIRGMMHLLCEREEEQQTPTIYALAFEVREERIFGSVTLERIVEHSGFVAFHWVADAPEKDLWHARYVSNSVSKFGYKREDFYDNRFTWSQFVYEEDRDLLQEEVLEHLRSGKLEYTRQYRINTADGQVIPVHDYVHLITDGADRLLGVEIVIFDLLMETERNANLLLLENAVNRSSNIVLVWQYRKGENQKKEIRYVSSNIEQLGISVTALRSGEEEYGDYIHPEDREKVERVYGQFEQKGYQYLSQEYRIVNSAKQEFWVRDESNLVELPGGMRYIESILTDISRSKRRELQLIEQQENLERKIRYIESSETMLSDMSVVDFINKEELQELQGAFASITHSYNAIIDLDGEPITFPDGPETNMGAFYDMFERSEYKKGYFELNKKLRKEHGPVRMQLSDFSDQELEAKRAKSGSLPQEGSLIQLVKASSMESVDATPGVMVGIPLFIDDKHMATWINCAFTQSEIDQIDTYLPALWNICKYMAQFVYSNTISQKQAQKARLSEVQARELLERSSVIRDILRRCNETNDDEALSYVLHKVGEYLKVSRISLFHYTQEQNTPTCWYEWDAPGMEKNVDSNADKIPHVFEMQKDAFSQKGQVILNGDKIPIRVRRILWDHHVRAIVALPIYTLTQEQQYITFVESNYERIWTDEELSFMHTTVSILQGFLQRMRSNVNVHDVTETQLEFVAMSRDYIYIKDEETEEIVYVNPRLEEVIGKDAVGRKCYEVFRRQSIRCMDCYQKRKECRELCNSRIYNYLFNRPMRIREMHIDWANRGHMKMVLLSPEDGQ